MSDSKAIQSMTVISDIQKEVKNTLDQITKLDISSSTNVDAQGRITGPAAVLLTKIHSLRDLLEITRGCAVFEGIDRRVTEMARAGQNMRAAFLELTDQKDPKAKEWISTIVSDWDAAAIK